MLDTPHVAAARELLWRLQVEHALGERLVERTAKRRLAHARRSGRRHLVHHSAQRRAECCAASDKDVAVVRPTVKTGCIVTQRREKLGGRLGRVALARGAGSRCRVRHAAPQRHTQLTVRGELVDHVVEERDAGGDGACASRAFALRPAMAARRRRDGGATATPSPRRRRDGAAMAPRWRCDGAAMVPRWRCDDAAMAPR